MKKLLTVLSAVILCASFVRSEEISVVGTGSGMELLESLASEYMKLAPGSKVAIPPSIGSGGGITAVSKNSALIGRVSRPLKDAEKLPDLKYVEFAKIPIVFFTHPSAGVKNLTRQQYLDIFAGKIENWKEVGGNDLPILLVKREKGDSSLDVLTQAMKGFSGENISKDAKTQFTDQKTIQYVVSTKGSIAFGSLANTADVAVTVLSVDGVSALDKNYPFLGVLALIYKDGNFKGDLKGFVDFVTSAKAKAVITKAHGIPVI